jgi:DNA-cytosine methyltransferase
MNVLSLFDGMSCGQIALNKLGIKYDNYFAAEIDKYAIKVTKANYPNTKHLGSVVGVKAEDLPKIDLLIGGSPCQGFSFAGKQLNFDDPRSKLFFEFVRLLEECKPKYFLLENVRMKKEYQDVISKYLGVEPIMINSSLVSAQNRVRLYWTNIPSVEQPKNKGIVLGDIIENFQGDPVKDSVRNRRHYKNLEDKSLCMSATMYKGAGNNGMTLIPRCGAIRGRYIKDGKRQDHKGSVAGKTTQRLEVRKDGKTNTLTTVQKDNVVVTPPTYRKLTPLECERLQTVPDNYTNHVSNTQRYKMLGNGWTVDVICHIFKNINQY